MNEPPEVRPGPDNLNQRFSPRKGQSFDPEKIREARIASRVVPDIRQAAKWAREGFISQEAFEKHLIGGRIAAEVRASKSFEAHQKAYMDALTGLPNRNAFEERFEGMVRRAHKQGKEVTVMVADNKGLGDMNKAHGHEGGDSFLAVTAANLRVAVNHQGKVFRYGGDEWIVVIFGGIDKGKHIWEAINTVFTPPQKMSYPKADGTVATIEEKINLRATIARVDPNNPLNSVVLAKERLNDAKDAHKNRPGNLLLETAPKSGILTL